MRSVFEWSRDAAQGHGRWLAKWLMLVTFGCGTEQPTVGAGHEALQAHAGTTKGIRWGYSPHVTSSQDGACFPPTVVYFRNDIPVPGDYDGDGRTDYAVFRRYDTCSNATTPVAGWWVKYAAGGGTHVSWGAPTDKSVSAIGYYAGDEMNGQVAYALPAVDYDGDGKADLALAQIVSYDGAPALRWNVRFAKGGSQATIWGRPSDAAVPGNYSNDAGSPGAEIAVWQANSGTWSVHGFPIKSRVVGQAGDKPVPADFNGDGITDFAVYRPSTGEWLIAYVAATNSATPAPIKKTFGASTDVPAPFDHDGDGRADLAVYRPAEARWYMTDVGQTWTKTFDQGGHAGEVPVPGTYRGTWNPAQTRRLAEPALYRPNGPDDDHPNTDGSYWYVPPPALPAITWTNDRREPIDGVSLFGMGQLSALDSAYLPDSYRGRENLFTDEILPGIEAVAGVTAGKRPLLMATYAAVNNDTIDSEAKLPSVLRAMRDAEMHAAKNFIWTIGVWMRPAQCNTMDAQMQANVRSWGKYFSKYYGGETVYVRPMYELGPYRGDAYERIARDCPKVLGRKSAAGNPEQITACTQAERATIARRCYENFVKEMVIGAGCSTPTDAACRRSVLPHVDFVWHALATGDAKLHPDWYLKDRDPPAGTGKYFPIDAPKAPPAWSVDDGSRHYGREITVSEWQAAFPATSLVDWLGVSWYFQSEMDATSSVSGYAAKHTFQSFRAGLDGGLGKPVFVVESAPKNEWSTNFAGYVNRYLSAVRTPGLEIKAFTYFNIDWQNGSAAFADWGDSRLNAGTPQANAGLSAFASELNAYPTRFLSQ